jgi:hypothetical protein
MGKNGGMIIALAFLIWSGSAGFAHAYLDPGTGSFFLQMLIGGIAGSLVAIKMYWSRVKAFFSGHGPTPMDSKDAS